MHVRRGCPPHDSRSEKMLKFHIPLSLLNFTGSHPSYQQCYLNKILTIFFLVHNIDLIQNSQAVKKECGPEKGYGEKRCEIQGGGQEMAVMVG